MGKQTSSKYSVAGKVAGVPFVGKAVGVGFLSTLDPFFFLICYVRHHHCCFSIPAMERSRVIVVGRTAQFSGIFCCGGAVDRDSRRVRKGSINDICVVKVLIVVPVSVSESTDVGTVLLLGVF